MSRAFPVTGGKQIADTLTALGKRIESQAVRAGLTAAGSVIRDEARLRAPKKSGKMAKAIKTGSPRKDQGGNYSISVRLIGEHAFLGMFHEFGVKPHLITAGDSPLSVRALNKRAAKGGIEKRDNGLVKIGGYSARDYTNKAGEVTGSLIINKHFVGYAVFHPGHAAQPFLRPALDAKAEEAVSAFRAKVVAVVEGKTGFNLDAGLDEAA